MLPRVILHNAVSVDGRFDGIEPDPGRCCALAGTWKSQATIAGSHTTLASGMPDDDADGVRVGKPRVQAFPDGTLWLRHRVLGRAR